MELDKKNNLTQRVLQAQTKGIIPEELIQDISLKVYNFILKTRGLSEEDAGGFILHIHPRIPGMIKNFQYKNLPFRNYLFAGLNFQLISFKKNIWRKKQKEKMEAYLNDQDVHYDSFPGSGQWTNVAENLPPRWEQNEKGEIRNSVLRKRLLILMAKNAPILEEEQIKTYSRLLGHPEDDIFKIAQTMKDKRTKYLEKYEYLKMRRNRLFTLIIDLDHQLQFTSPQERIEIQKRRKKIKDRLQRLQSQLGKLEILPTHEEIAHYLEIPKGTVDSALYYIKKSIKNTLS